MSLKQNFLSAFRVMNFVVAQRVWRALSSEADFRVGKELPKSNILIVAPHPDDEIFGCAGVMGTKELKNIRTEELKSCLPAGRNRRTEEHKIRIVYLFSGDEKSQSKQASDREEESKEAVRLLTNLEQIFFRQPDNSVIGKEVISQLSEIIRGLGEGIIFLPSFSDPNIDHRETVRATIEGLKIAAIKNLKLKNLSIWLYEIWNPLPYFNRLLEFDWKEKEKATEKFKSQLKDRNYIKAIKSLNEYRGEIYGLPNPAEAFFALPADLLVKIFQKETR